MSKNTQLREKFEKESTDKKVFNSDGYFTTYYINWLESQILENLCEI